MRSKKTAEQSKAFILQRAALSGKPASVELIQYTIHPTDASSQTRQPAEVHVVLYAPEFNVFAREFWEYSGLGISSRFAEYCLSLLPVEDRLSAKPSEEVDQPADTISPPGVSSKDQTTLVEERPGEDLDLSAGAFAKQVLRRRIAAAITTGKIQDGLQEPCNGAQDSAIGHGSRGLQDVTEDDVFLFPTGMAAIWEAYNLYIRARGEMKSVVFG